MSKKKQQPKMTVAQWCDEQVKNGHTLTLKWDGGNDSGWVYFELDGEELTNEYTEKLVDYCYSELDYGSWAGDFSANGEAEYDPKRKSVYRNRLLQRRRSSR